MDTNLHFDIKNLTEKQVEHLAKNAVEYAVINGVLMQSKTSPGKTKHAPFILFPTPFPKTLFEQARLVQLDFNLLVHNVSQDHEFLKESLKGTIIADEFTRRIYDIHEQTRNEGIVQPISVGLLRSDYMLQNDKDILLSSPKECNHHLRIKQVEIQTMAAGGTEVNARVAQIGSYVLGLLDKDIPVGSPQLPSNPVGSKIAEGLALALEFYGSKSAIILMVTDPADSAKCDQLWIEYCLHERNPRIKMLRRSLPELHKDAKLGPNRELIVDGCEVAVVYYRYGFNPSEYPSEDAWAARLLVERSLAIKCPTAAVQLVGTKKIQQVLAQSGVLERFITDEAALRRMRETFTGLYSLDEGPEGDQTEKMALANPEKFVLKPQREGGGQNFFGDDIKTVLNQVKCPHERSQYILMDKIQGPTTKNYIVRPEFDKPLFGDVICELGIFGVYISIGGKVIVNREIGHKIRTKSAEHQDGGVNRGIANYDSPYLF